MFIYVNKEEYDDGWIRESLENVGYGCLEVYGIM